MSSEATGCSEKLEEFLPYELDFIPDELRKRAKTELFEDEDTRIYSLRLFRSMLKEEPDLRWQDDDLFLLSYLRTRKFDVKKAFNLIKTFYTVKGKHGELYDNFNFADVKKTLGENIVGFLPYRDSEGCVILVIRFSAWNYHVTKLADLMRALTAGLFHANLSPATQIAGFKVIVNVAGCTLKHLPHITPNYLWLFTEALQNCFPGRFKAVHIVNEDSIFSYIWVILKQFLSKKIRERFHFHGKNVKKLHKYFSPRVLPAEFEGELPPFDNTEWGKMLEEKSDYFCHLFSHGYQNPKAKTSKEKKKT